MKFSHIATAMLVLTASVGAHAANFCGDLKTSYGPFDYRKRSEFPSNFEIVESYHFTPDVENGIKGATGTIGGDLQYTLAVIPNHLRALATLTRVALSKKAVQLESMKYPVECYFERATRYAPDDGAVRAAYGSYLYALDKPDQAFVMFKEAVRLDPDNPTINYNLGLAYAKRKEYALAMTHAKKAYAQGFPLPGLKNKLIEAGKWNDKSN